MEPNTILVVLPHPDDEGIIAGTLIQYAKQGAEITYICLTLGEMGRNLGMPPFANRVTLPEIRRQELHACCQIIGIQQVESWGLMDKTVEFEDQELWIQRIMDKMKELKPSLVLTFYPGHDGERDVLLFASNGKAVRFGEEAVRSMGRTATGVRGIRLAKGEDVVSLIVAERAAGAGAESEDEAADEVAESNDETVLETIQDESGCYILTATENGYGKRTPLADYPRKGRGTQGVIGIQTNERNGKLVGALLLGNTDEVMLISDGGTLVRTRSTEISCVGRNTQGVTLIRLSKGEKLQAIERLDASLEEEEDAVTADASAEAPPPSPAG